MDKFFILSFDGGGIRGAFAARIMEHIQKSNNLQFDLICGTSTGAILASAYAYKLDFTHMVQLYKQAASTIFKKRFFLGPPLLQKAVVSPYDSNRLQAVLRSVFGHTKFKDIKIPLLITATNIEHSTPFIFKSYNKQFDNILLYKAISASCAAPTYFDPVNIDNNLLADGGLCINNPSCYALGEAIEYFNINTKDIYVLSIGSGHFTKCYDKNISSWGVLNGWKSRTLVEFISSLQSETTYLNLTKILGSDNILRLNYDHDTIIKTDDFASNDHLIELADHCYACYQDKINKFLTR